ncbi:MAG: tRNA-dihydrouridine synthase family protein [Treponema sp.]|nr:tRNA-dihydrouridine synthase family protein [Treponema sp.]
MAVPFILAPMAELGHRALRELIESFGSPGAPRGAHEYYSEMISAGALVSGGPYEAWYMDNGPCPEKLVYQLVGNSQEQIIRAAELLNRLQSLGIDINMGCSAPAIKRMGAGVAWMGRLDEAGALIRALRPRVKGRLSVKLRIGLEDDFEYLVQFCRRLEEEGLDFITLHPRCARDKFRGRAKWAYIPLLRRELKIPLGGNGDIGSAQEMLERSGDCDALMVGRLALKQPWVFDQARALAEEAEAEGDIAPDLCRTGLEFLDLLERYQPPPFYLSRARRFFAYFCQNLTWASHVQKMLFREETLTGMRRVWESHFAEVAAP